MAKLMTSVSLKSHPQPKSRDHTQALDCKGKPFIFTAEVAVKQR